MGSRPGSRRGNDPAGNRRSEGQAREGPQIASLGSRLRTRTRPGAGSSSSPRRPNPPTISPPLSRKGSASWKRRSREVAERWKGALGTPLGIGRRRPLPLARDSTARAGGQEPSRSGDPTAHRVGCCRRGARGFARLLLRAPLARRSLSYRRKLGGILCESSFLGRRCEFAIAGIGVNVNQRAEDFPQDVAVRATSLSSILGREVDPLEVAVAIVLSFEKSWERDIPSILAGWRDRARPLDGARVQVAPREGTSYAATIVGLADDGGLEVRLDDGATKSCARTKCASLPSPVTTRRWRATSSRDEGALLFISPSEMGPGLALGAARRSSPGRERRHRSRVRPPQDPTEAAPALVLPSNGRSGVSQVP